METGLEDDIRELEAVKDGKFQLSIDGLKALDQIYHIKQMRFYCNNADGVRIIDIATGYNSKGQKVVDNFLGREAYGSEDACGSYYTLPSDSSTLTADCSGIVWTKPDRQDRLTNSPMYNTNHAYNVFYFAAQRSSGWVWYGCDDKNLNNGVTAQGRWMVFVR